MMKNLNASGPSHSAQEPSLNQIWLSDFVSKIKQKAPLDLRITQHWSSFIEQHGVCFLNNARTKNGLLILLCKFSGGGLGLAAGLAPLFKVFNEMTLAGYDLPRIVSEMNRLLFSILPTSALCRAVCIELNPVNGSCHIWNGGMPDMFIFRAHQSPRRIALAYQWPLGVVGAEQFSPYIHHELLSPQDSIVLFTEGWKNFHSEQHFTFAPNHFEKFVMSQNKAESCVEAFASILSSMPVELQQDMDLGVVSLKMASVESAVLAATTHFVPRDWEVTTELRAPSLKNFDPIPFIRSILNDYPELDPIKYNLYTVLIELYTNSLEHGLLRLDSRLKSTPAGFLQYYQERAERLQGLMHGWIRLSVQQLSNTGKQGKLILRVEDSGRGFDYQLYHAVQLTGRRYQGRGIALIRSLAKTLRYEGSGNRAEAVLLYGEEH